jgi:prepilin-type processing-associated H-X9-DG protein
MRRAAWVRAEVRAALFATFGWALTLLLAAAAPVSAADADPVPPAPLAHYFPRQDLVVYAEFGGLDAHARIWQKSAAYRLLNETTTGAMLEDIVTQLADRALSSAPGPRLTGNELLTVVEQVARSGFAFGIVRKPGEPKPSCIGLVLRGAAQGKVWELVGRILDAGKGPGNKTQVVNKPGGRTVIIEGGPPSQGFAWWKEGNDLVLSLVSPEGPDILIETLDGVRPDATDHPIRAALARAEDGFTPLGLAFFEMAALPALPPQAAALGFDKITRLDYRWGFQGEALMTVTRVVAPAPRAGILALFDQPTFDQRGLLPLPPGLAGFTAFSIDPDAFYERLAALAGTTDPKGAVAFDSFAKSIERATGHRLREDVLAHLGPRVVSYDVPTKVNAPTNALAGLALGFAHTPKTSIVIEVKDPEAFGKILDDLMTKAEASFEAQAAANPGNAAVGVRRLKGALHGYVLSIPPSVSPLPAGLRPTILLGKKTLILGSTPEAARGALALEGQGGGLPAADPLARALGQLPDKMIFLTTNDTQQSLLPDVLANLPGLIQVIGSAATTGVRPRFLPGGPPPRPVGSPGFQLNIDADEIPAPDDLRPFLFPSMVAFTVDDQGFQFVSRESFPALNPVALAPLAAALLLPAVQSARTAARRAQSVNNLKQIGLALHNFHSANNHFPPQAITDKTGKPLLSWRVAILPFLEQSGMFNEFKLDEPWDSPHNKALIERMPITYAIPGAEAEPGMTFYRGFSGAHTLFDPQLKNGTGIQNVTDGTSNTLGIVEAKEAVPWTKPDDEIPFDAAATKPEQLQELLSSMGSHFPGGFNALFLDGSVRFLKLSINVQVLKALITRDGGEVISSDSF